MEFEFTKIVCQTVVAVRDGDRVIDEVVGQTVACYTPEQLLSLYERTQEEVGQRNAQEQASGGNGNRQQRRARKKVEPKVPEEV